MGAIVFRGREFVPVLSETVGYKSGLALSAQRLQQIVEDLGFGDYWPHDADSWLRIRSEVYEEMFAGILGQLGAGPERWIVSAAVVRGMHRGMHRTRFRGISGTPDPLNHADSA